MLDGEKHVLWECGGFGKGDRAEAVSREKVKGWAALH